MKQKTKTRKKGLIRSYTADWHHLRLVAMYSDGRIAISLYSTAEVKVSGVVLPGQTFPTELKKILENKLRTGLDYDRHGLLRDLFLKADSSASFRDFVAKIRTRQ